MTASTTEVTSCAAALEVKQISPERNFEEKLKGRKNARYWNLCRSSNSYCISDEQRRSPSPTPPPTAARPVPQQNQPPKTAQAKETAEASQRRSEQGEGFHSRLPTLFYTTVLSLTNRRLHAKYFHSSGSNKFATSNSAKRSFVET